MSQCQEMFYLMNLELDGEISAQEQLQLNAHRATCPQCAALSEELRQMQIAVQSLDEIEVPEGFSDRVIERIQQETAPAPKVVLFRKKLVRYGSLAACGLLCVGLYQSGIFQIASDTSSSSSSLPSAMYMSASTTTAMETEMERAPMDMPVAEIAQEESMEESVNTTTATTVDARGGLTLPEQVMAELGVDEISAIMIYDYEMPETLPEGIEVVVTLEHFSYAIVAPEHWNQVRQQFNYGISEEPLEEDTPCVLILMES